MIGKQLSIFGNIICFVTGAMLLATGAFIERFYPPVIYWFLGAAGFAALCIVAIFGLVLMFDAIDMSERDDMNYPG